MIEKTVVWYRDNAVGRERIGGAIERLGLDKYMDEVVVPLGLEAVRDPKERMKYYAKGNYYGR